MQSPGRRQPHRSPAIREKKPANRVVAPTGGGYIARTPEYTPVSSKKRVIKGIRRPDGHAPSSTPANVAVRQAKAG